MNENIKYFLVLEILPGNYNLIDIEKLDICNDTITNDIASIDLFTSKYSIDEIKASIMRSNISRGEYLNGNLKIYSDHNHNLEIIDKNDYELIREFQLNNEEINKDLKNKILSKYIKIIENTFTNKDFSKGLIEKYKEVIRNNNKQEMFKMIEELPYNKTRIIYLCISEELRKKNVEKLRKLEKIND